jgi:hypothetical protein
VKLRPLLVSLIVAFALFAPGSAGAGSDWFGWSPIHLHLNAYAHWGKCFKQDGSSGVNWSDHYGHCSGITGAELGELDGVSFLNHSSKCSWIWSGNQLTVSGVDKNGHPWGLEGIKSDDFSKYAAERVKIHSKEYTAGPLYLAPAGTPGGPLAVHLASHTYSSGISVAHGYSINLQGYVRVK